MAGPEGRFDGDGLFWVIFDVVAQALLFEGENDVDSSLRFSRREWRAFSMMDTTPLKAEWPYSEINWLRLCILVNSDMWQP